MTDIAIVYSGIISVYEKCNIKQFPIDCFDILIQYGLKIKKFSELSEKKLAACNELSDDATLLKKTIYYNDKKLSTRIRFSLMHELGHVVLKTESEDLADSFASHILAPRIAIHYSKCKNINDVMKKFDISKRAANIAFDDYCRWYKEASLKGMSATDKDMYNHFFNPIAKKFVWKIQECDFCCNEHAYNDEIYCPTCKIYELRKRTSVKTYFDPCERNLDILRGTRLYGEL